MLVKFISHETLGGRIQKLRYHINTLDADDTRRFYRLEYNEKRWFRYPISGLSF